MAEYPRLGGRGGGGRRLPSRFVRDRRGAITVEFALVAMPFLVLIFSVIELGLVSLVSVSLENAVLDTSREIRTGEAQTTAVTAAVFQAKVCERMGWLGDQCTGALSIDVRSFVNFTDSATKFAEGVPATPCWDPGGPGSTVLVRAYYTWPLITPMLQTGLQTANGKRVIPATAAFANEPYSDIPAPPKC